MKSEEIIKEEETENNNNNNNDNNENQEEKNENQEENEKNEEEKISFQITFLNNSLEPISRGELMLSKEKLQITTEQSFFSLNFPEVTISFSKSNQKVVKLSSISSMDIAMMVAFDDFETSSSFVEAFQRLSHKVQDENVEKQGAEKWCSFQIQILNQQLKTIDSGNLKLYEEKLSIEGTKEKYMCQIDSHLRVQRFSQGKSLFRFVFPKKAKKGFCNGVPIVLVEFFSEEEASFFLKKYSSYLQKSRQDPKSMSQGNEQVIRTPNVFTVKILDNFLNFKRDGQLILSQNEIRLVTDPSISEKFPLNNTFSIKIHPKNETVLKIENLKGKSKWKCTSNRSLQKEEVKKEQKQEQEQEQEQEQKQKQELTFNITYLDNRLNSKSSGLFKILTSKIQLFSGQNVIEEFSFQEPLSVQIHPKSDKVLKIKSSKGKKGVCVSNQSFIQFNSSQELRNGFENYKQFRSNFHQKK
ncbi:hypothetical protein M0811_13874 [Anaeramoeba ignava]|uniref:Uncharacterized protein n=1 Tax=Anaeramoeba ignava TaxID=1746090 RepID=A0A9Q0M0J0_ANAIG|nr:hypothetical protein M0811_13874 [Anaeramoeba ignava]